MINYVINCGYCSALSHVLGFMKANQFCFMKIKQLEIVLDLLLNISYFYDNFFSTK